MLPIIMEQVICGDSLAVIQANGLRLATDHHRGAGGWWRLNLLSDQAIGLRLATDHRNALYVVGGETHSLSDQTIGLRLDSNHRRAVVGSETH